MQAFTHLALVALLFVIPAATNAASAVSNGSGVSSSTSSAITATTTDTTSTASTTPTTTTDTASSPTSTITATTTDTTSTAGTTPTTTTDTASSPTSTITATTTDTTSTASTTPTTTTDTASSPTSTITATTTDTTSTASTTPTTTTDTASSPTSTITATTTDTTSTASTTPTTTTDTASSPTSTITATTTDTMSTASTTPTTTTDTASSPTSTITATTTDTTSTASTTPTTTTDTASSPTSTITATTTDTASSTATPTAPATISDTASSSASTTAPTTIIKGDSPGTVPSVTSSSVTSPKTSNPNADTTNPCQKDSCSDGSSCISLNNTHFCLCLDGHYYNSSSCKKGKVFPGIIQVKTPDTSDLENEKSVNYENLYKEVTKFFGAVFINSDYGQTVIQKVRIPAPARSQVRADDKVVDVTVVNLFAKDTDENEMTISTAINDAISNSSVISTYTKQDRCDFYGCVKSNEQDDCSDGFQCKCQPGYERPNPYTATCLPASLKCPDACNAAHMQCLVEGGRNPVCVCLAGYEKDNQGNCQACAFGYTGVNCEDNFQLILTVVGSIAGFIVLGLVIELIITRSKKTKDIEEQNLIENDYQNLGLQQTTGFSSPAQGSIFPKVTAQLPRAGGLHNPYANPASIPRPDY